MPNLVIKSGEKYGHLIVVHETDRIRLPCGQVNRQFLCKCMCGNLTNVRVLHLVRGRISSCGCMGKGMNGDSHLKLAHVWRGMIRRCQDTYEFSHLYSKRGIFVCEEWMSNWTSFKKWALSNGYKDGLQIDRINNDGIYHPLNCRWVTPKQNCNNRRITLTINYKGEIQSLCMLAYKLGMERHLPTFRQRLRNGWHHNDIIDIPIKKGNYKTSPNTRKYY